MTLTAASRPNSAAALERAPLTAAWPGRPAGDPLGPSAAPTGVRRAAGRARVREDLIARIREELTAGRYLTQPKLDLALDRLIALPPRNQAQRPHHSSGARSA